MDKNPLGILGIDHLEFCSTTRHLDELFTTIGLCHTHESKFLSRYSCNEITFVINRNPNDAFLLKHGEGVSKISFRVKNCVNAMNESQKRGAVKIQDIFEDQNGKIKKGQIQGLGNLINEFVERDNNTIEEIYKETQNKASQLKLFSIDHLTNNVPMGEMKKWVKFYCDIFNFEVTRYFNIQGNVSGLQSEVVQSYNSKVIIPINEPKAESDEDQIYDFLKKFKGPGVQHIAFLCKDIVTTIKELRKRGMKFLKIPKTYYENIPNRNLNIKEDLVDLEEQQILVDGDSSGYLLQIFSENLVGPLFFEFIERKGHNGFGEGNFQELFNALERDQLKRISKK